MVEVTRTVAHAATVAISLQIQIGQSVSACAMGRAASRVAEWGETARAGTTRASDVVLSAAGILDRAKRWNTGGGLPPASVPEGFRVYKLLSHFYF